MTSVKDVRIVVLVGCGESEVPRRLRFFIAYRFISLHAPNKVIEDLHPWKLSLTGIKMSITDMAQEKYEGACSKISCLFRPYVSLIEKITKGCLRGLVPLL